MRLYHPAVLVITCTLAVLILPACTATIPTQVIIGVEIYADGETSELTVPADSTVQQVLNEVGTTLGSLDRVEPPLYTTLADGAVIRVYRVEEEITTEEEVLPFDQLRVPTEYLPEGETQIDPVQKGEPGLVEITYRNIYEDGELVSRTAFKSTIVEEPVPQIILVGIRTIHTPIEIPGRLVYLYNGDVWLMEGNTSNRKPVISSADLDGYIFSLSEDGDWLLFTRESGDESSINSLWAADLGQAPVALYDLKVENVIHFADWMPDSDNTRVIFSTVEPVVSAPGWQANNDLYVLSFSKTGWVSNWEENPLIEPNTGGLYGWWGTDYSWAPDGEKLAFASPDRIGLIAYPTLVITPVIDVLPYQTLGDWAWVPGLGWGPDGEILYTVKHESQEETVSPEQSANFDMIGINLDKDIHIPLGPQSGMFAYPVASPRNDLPSGESAHQVAYLEAIFPDQSDESRYRLKVIDRDGSNSRTLFPPPGEPGLEPQRVVWSPATLDQGEFAGNIVAFTYLDDLWFGEVNTGQAHQVTIDGGISRIAWR